jgi:UDP-glucose:(heptosyl)LPS alpha-1,3-glucosyltransferase
MKIAFVRKSYTPYGGAERYLARLIESLGERGHEIHIFAHRWEASSQISERKGPPVIFHHVPVIAAPSFLEALSFAFSSRRLLEREDFDIIHSFERTLYQDVYRAGDGCHREWLQQRRKIDSWIKRVSHPVNPLHRALLFLERRLFQSPRLKKIVANSRRGKEEIIRHYGVAKEKIEVIYNGVDLEAFHPRNQALYRKTQRREMGISESSFVILFLGSGFRRKGLDGLIEAFAQIVPEIPDAVLVVAGKDRIGPYRQEARSRGVERQVMFLGPTAKAKELYAASDLFALPTLYEPFSNACLEAMATGIPVLTTVQNGVAELIEDRRNGLLISEAKDSETMAEKIRFFYVAPKIGRAHV